MLSAHEKAYCRALLALKQKDYEKAAQNFESAAPGFGTNSEFILLYQTTRLLLEIKRELAATADLAATEKEIIING